MEGLIDGVAELRSFVSLITGRQATVEGTTIRGAVVYCSLDMVERVRVSVDVRFGSGKVEVRGDVA